MSADRNNDLAAIHIAAQRLGLDDTAYRALVQRETGHWSSGDADELGRRRLLRAMHKIEERRTMKITSIAIEAFEGIRRAELQIGDLTLLYGRNGAGKSSVADAIYYALLGSSPRGHVLADVIRQGERETTVELVIGGTSIMRQRSHKEGAAYIDGVQSSVGEIAASVSRVTGCSPDRLDCALQSGALLGMAAKDRQRLLLSLCGAGVIDGKAIAEAIDPHTRELMAAHKVSLPASIERIQAVYEDIVRRRQEAHREVVSATKLSENSGSMSAPEQDAAALDQQLVEQRRRREEAVRTQGQAAGVSEERRRQLRERAATLRAVPQVDEPMRVAEADLDRATRALLQLEADLSRQREQLEQTRAQAAGDATLPPGADTLDGRFQAATAAEAAARKTIDQRVQEWEALQTAIARGPQTCCPSCRQPVSADAIAGLRLCQEAYKQAGQMARKAHADALEQLEALRRERAVVEAVRLRLAAAERVEALGRDIASTELAITAARQRRDEAREARERQDRQSIAATAYQHAQEELRQIDAQLAAPATAVPAIDVAPIDAEIARLTRLRDQRQQWDRRQEHLRALEEHRRLHADLDAIAKQLGPGGGLRGKLIARAVAPFVTASNQLLARLLPGYAIEVVPDDGVSITVVHGGARLSTDRLSDGERTCVLYVLQLAVAQLARAPVVVFDRTELLDHDRRALLQELGLECGRAGIQALRLSNTPAPSAIAPVAGVVAYHLTDGECRPIPAAVAA